MDYLITLINTLNYYLEKTISYLGKNLYQVIFFGKKLLWKISHRFSSQRPKVKKKASRKSLKKAFKHLSFHSIVLFITSPFLILSISLMITFIYFKKRIPLHPVKSIQEIKEWKEHDLPILARPDFYSNKLFEFSIEDIHIPVLQKSSRKIHRYQVDLTFRTSNRYIKNYFGDIKSHHIDHIQNTLNMNLDPVLPGFLLSEEGKKIMEQKIKREINRLLKKMKIKGEIEEIYLNNMVGG